MDSKQKVEEFIYDRFSERTEALKLPNASAALASS
jgi:hypothetical protein